MYLIDNTLSKGHGRWLSEEWLGECLGEWLGDTEIDSESDLEINSANQRLTQWIREQLGINGSDSQRVTSRLANCQRTLSMVCNLKFKFLIFFLYSCVCHTLSGESLPLRSLQDTISSNCWVVRLWSSDDGRTEFERYTHALQAARSCCSCMQRVWTVEN